VRLPKSVHASLAQEAQREGVSLNQSIVAKLSVQLADAV
jgi:predicted HicB family RNase H-like nuclease